MPKPVITGEWATGQPLPRIPKTIKEHYNGNGTYLCRRCRLLIDLRGDLWYDLRSGTMCWGGSTKEYHSPWD